ncbi:MAG: hypothetical protein HKN13_06935 [Rhodothermales bacterium]|nr:hypothetical protein [Rhodothermales bacterium]
MMAPPGSYTVSLSQEVDGVVTELSGPQPFEVKRLRDSALAGASSRTVADFWRTLEDTQRKSYALHGSLGKAMQRAASMKVALQRATAAPGDLDKRIHDAQSSLQALDTMLNGPAAKRGIGARSRPTISSRLFTVELGVGRSTYGPTDTHREQLAIVRTQLDVLSVELMEQEAELTELVELLEAAGAPWIEGEAMPGRN